MSVSRDDNILILAAVLCALLLDMVIISDEHVLRAQEQRFKPSGRCFTYRFFDDRDTVRFETTCVKPLPDTVHIVIARTP